MTLVQGANLYVEQKVANLGTNVFRIARTPFAVTDFTVVARALRNRYFYLDDMDALAEHCAHCQLVGATSSSTASLSYKDKSSRTPRSTATPRPWPPSIPAPC
jgi:hypothetical protein